MKTSNANKVISVLMSVAMCPMMVPSAAFAADDDTASGGGSSPSTELTQFSSQAEGTDTGANSGTTPATQLEATGEAAGNGATLNENAAPAAATNEATAPAATTGEEGIESVTGEDSSETGIAEVNGKSYLSLQEAIDAASSKATVKLLADTKENVTISTRDVTFDLNGHTLNGSTGECKPALTVTARVTVKDSSETQTGTIKREDTAENSGVSSHYVIDIQGSGWLTFESGNVTNNSGNAAGKGASLVRVGDDSVAKYPGLTIKGGTFTQNEFIVIKVDSGNLFLNGGTLNSTHSYAIEDWHRATIRGGTVNGAVAAWTYGGGHNSDLTIEGGTVNGDVESVTYDGAEGKTAKVSITGGTVNGALSAGKYGSTSFDDPTKATIEVTGGTFSTDPSRYLIESSTTTQNADGTFGVEKAYLAQVGEAGYYTMDEAFKAQTENGGAITLLRDYTTGSTFNSGTVARVVDLNGHTWTCAGTDANSAAFEINNPNASLTVKNGKVVSSQLVGLIPSAMGGTIKYDNSILTFDGVEASTTATSGIETNGNNTNDTVVLKNSTLNVPKGFGIYFPSSGTLTIDNSTINAKTMGVQVCSGNLNVNAGSAITVSGDPVEKTEGDGAIQDGAAISVVNRPGYKGLGQVAITGGTFTAKGTNAAIKAYTWDSSTKQESDFNNAGKTVTVYGGTFSSAVPGTLCAEGCNPVENPNGTYGVSGSVAQVGFKAFDTLQAAIDAAQDGDTVTLLADATEDVTVAAGKSITLDLGGKTLTNTNNGKATISVQGGTVTVKNGNVAGGTSYYNIEVTKGSNANLTLTDVTATAGNNGSSMIDNWGTMTIASGTYTGGLNVVKSEEGSKLIITGGTFTRTTAPRWGVTGTVLVCGTTTITGGTFNEKSTSANARVVVTGRVDGYDSVTYIKGGTFNGNGNNVFHHLSPARADDSFEVSGGTFNKSIPDYYCTDGFIPKSNGDGTYGVKEGKFVAKVGSTGYETFDEAIAAANASTKSKTVSLCENITVDHQLVINNAKGKTITLDLNDFTLTSTYAMNNASSEARYALVNKTTLTVKKGTFAAGEARAIGAYGALTLNGATVTQTLTGGQACVAFCANGKAYTIENSTIDGAYAVCNFANNATINITGSKLIGTGNTLYHNGSNYGLKLTVKDTAITSSGSDGCGVYISGSTSAQSNADNQNGAGGYQKAVFTGCTISGATNGVEVKYTDLTLDSCTASTTAENASYEQENNGPAGSGFAVVSTDNAMNNVTPKPEGTIIIKGAGKYTGPVGLGSLKSVKETYPDFADETIKVSDGTFTVAVPEAYCAAGYTPTANADGTYGVKLAEGAYLLQKYRTGGQASWKYPTMEGMAFAGWYKDAEFKTACTASDVEGAAYAKFVNITDLLKFKGGSLRMNVGDAASSTNLRFGYTKTIPEGSKYVENGWYFKTVSSSQSEVVRKPADNNVLNNDGTVTANLVFTGVTTSYYDAMFSEKAFVKYVTVDGTTVEAVEGGYRQRSVKEVANLILKHPMASQTEKNYATKILAAQ